MGSLKASDTTEGLARRLSIVNFEAEFVDRPDPDNPLQHKKDVHILDKLMGNLPGIFNWVFEGYRMLRMNNGMTETDDHAETIKRFKEASNPIFVFCEEL